MSNFLDRLFHRKDDAAAHRDMDRAYVSDYSRFIGQFLEKHPEALAEQHDGWRIYWDKQVDQAALEKAEQDKVPDDGYGFYSSAWTDHKH
ncbi:MAG: DUF3460 family protein [Bacteroidota bacterium]